MIDIRMPIGLLFSIVGAILALYGLSTSSDPVFYKSSFGININLIMGSLMLVFGLIMLYFVSRKNRRSDFGKEK